MKRTIVGIAASLVTLLSRPVMADPSPFDLSGPSLRISVTRHGVTLPIGAVPQLAVGDTVKVETALPADETAHYVLVAAFLRDPTNPPPATWFRKSESWRRSGRGGGAIELTIPATAQHLVLFLAPATGGDFNTLRSAVTARPGAFVRAAQDLEQASLDRGRYDAYVEAIRKVSASAPETLGHVAPVVAGSLRIRINQDCLQRQAEFQSACLLDSRQSMVLGNDTSSNSLLSGTATDLALSLSSTPVGGLGYYSPYIGAIREIIGIFGAMHTARYQYIPALGVARGDLLALALNTPPSFGNPKSVLMAALPAIKDTHPPTLQTANAAPEACLGAKAQLLTMAADPVIYAAAYAHDLALQVQLPEGKHLDLPLTPDATRGGLAIGSSADLAGDLAGHLAEPHLAGPPLSGPLMATVHGMWGFDAFTGPQISLQTAGAWQWQPNGTIRNDGLLQLTGAPAMCVTAVTVARAHGPVADAPWKMTGPQGIVVTLPAPDEKPEPITVAVVGPLGSDPATLTVTPLAKAAPPVAQVIAHSSEPARIDPASAPASGIAIGFGSDDEIPADARLSFTLKAEGNERFVGREIVELSTAGSDTIARLTFGNGLTLVDAGIMVANLTPAQVLGASAFGPLRVRLVRGGLAGNWSSLGTLVRLPQLKHLACPTDAAKPCTLTGDGLYLLASVSATRDFDSATSVPEGYPGFTLKVPHPASGVLYIRLHDAPEVVNRMAETPARPSPSSAH